MVGGIPENLHLQTKTITTERRPLSSQGFSGKAGELCSS